MGCFFRKPCPNPILFCISGITEKIRLGNGFSRMAAAHNALTFKRLPLGVGGDIVSHRYHTYMMLIGEMGPAERISRVAPALIRLVTAGL